MPNPFQNPTLFVSHIDILGLPSCTRCHWREVANWLTKPPSSPRAHTSVCTALNNACPDAKKETSNPVAHKNDRRACIAHSRHAGLQWVGGVWGHNIRGAL